VFVLIFCYFFM